VLVMSIMLTMKMKMMIMLLDEDYRDEMVKMEIMVIMMKMNMMFMIDAYYVDDEDDDYD
jgi:hypothetical protein